MKTKTAIKTLSSILFAAAFMASGSQAETNDVKSQHKEMHNGTQMSHQKHVEGTVEPRVFVEKASASGVAEIEMAKIALEKSTQVDVRHFAQMMIEDHTAANKELNELAVHKGLPTAGEPTQKKQAKAATLAQKKGETFDQAYANSQVKAHEEAVILFRQAANSKDKDVRDFAEAKLPTLEYHLETARALADTVAQIHASGDRTSKGSHNPKSVD